MNKKAILLIPLGFITFLILIGGWFYWFQYRPSNIRQACSLKSQVIGDNNTVTTDSKRYWECLNNNGLASTTPIVKEISEEEAKDKIDKVVSCLYNADRKFTSNLQNEMDKLGIYQYRQGVRYGYTQDCIYTKCDIPDLPGSVRQQAEKEREAERKKCREMYSHP